MLTTLRQRNFALLWFARLASVIGTWVLNVALPFYVYEVTGSALATGLLFIVRTLPGVLLGTLAGVFVDRWDRKRTMVIVRLSTAFLLLLLLAVRSVEWLWVLYLVAFFESAIAQFFGPAENALLPRLVAEEHLMAANSLIALNSNLGMLIGPTIGGALVGLLGLTSVVFFDSASCLIAGAMILLVSWSPDLSVEASEATGMEGGAAMAWMRIWREWLGGVRMVKRDRLIAAIFIGGAIALLGEGVINALLVPFVELLQGGALELGWLLTLRGLGGLIGGLVFGHIDTVMQLHRIFPLTLAGMGLLLLIMFNFPMLLLALVVLCLIGILATGVYISSQTMLQNSVDDRYRGRIFGALGTTVALCTVGGQGLASALADRLGVVVMLNVAGTLYALAGAIALLMLRRTLVERDSAKGDEPC